MKEKIVPIVLKKSGNNKQISPAKNWVFTCNNYTPEKIKMIVNDSSIKRYSFQEEIGEEEGTPHLQGYVEFKEKTRPCPRLVLFGGRWEKVCKAVLRQNNKCKASILYTQKDSTRAPGGKLYLKGCKKYRPLKVYKYEELYEWQKEIASMAEEEPCDRLIHWFWEPKGCRGKTQLCKYLVVNHDALLIGGAKADMFYQVANCKEPPEIILINLANGSRMPDMQAIESIKDGIFASPKYESKMFIMNSPHIFVFANREPILGEGEYDHSKRWKVRELIPSE